MHRSARACPPTKNDLAPKVNGTKVKETCSSGAYGVQLSPASGHLLHQAEAEEDKSKEWACAPDQVAAPHSLSSAHSHLLEALPSWPSKSHLTFVPRSCLGLAQRRSRWLQRNAHGGSFHSSAPPGSLYPQPASTHLCPRFRTVVLPSQTNYWL